MSNQKSELIWAGRIHLGDDPGVYGDAAYTGLVTEFPITLTKCGTEPQDDISLILSAEDVQVYEPYPGHQVTVVGYKKIAESDPPRARRGRTGRRENERGHNQDSSRQYRWHKIL